MPFVSKAQNGWAHTPEGTKALGGPAAVKEWEGATDYKSLPGHVGHHAQGGTVNKGARSEIGHFASGGAVLPRSEDWKKTPDSRFLPGQKKPKPESSDAYGAFLDGMDKFSGINPAADPIVAKGKANEEDWAKGGKADDLSARSGDAKSEKPRLPRGRGPAIKGR